MTKDNKPDQATPETTTEAATSQTSPQFDRRGLLTPEQLKQLDEAFKTPEDIAIAISSSILQLQSSKLLQKEQIEFFKADVKNQDLNIARLIERIQYLKQKLPPNTYRASIFVQRQDFKEERAQCRTYIETEDYPSLLNQLQELLKLDQEGILSQNEVFLVEIVSYYKDPNEKNQPQEV